MDKKRESCKLADNYMMDELGEVTQTQAWSSTEKDKGNDKGKYETNT